MAVQSRKCFSGQCAIQASNLCKCFSGYTGMNNKDAGRFKGSLVGAVVGDCLGNPFEFKSRAGRISELLKDGVGKIESAKNAESAPYTDDTAMTRSVAKSLIVNRGFNAKDLAERFAKEYHNDSGRGYGANIIYTLRDLYEKKYGDDVFQSAKEQFGGSGSYGNGGAMRIAPVALFGAFSLDKLIEIARESTKITHSNELGYNGAILQCLAVQQAFSTDVLDRDKFLDDLLMKMRSIEKAPDEETGEAQSLEHQQPYCQLLEKAKSFLQQDTRRETIRNELGVGISAQKSVTTAIYSFLRCSEPVDYLAELDKDNPFSRTILYAISLGGDTDTIASMAGAIAGAYYGLDSIPKVWQDKCEGVKHAKKQAEQLYELALTV